MVASSPGWRRYGPLSLLLAGVAVTLYAVLAVLLTAYPESTPGPWPMLRHQLTQASTFVVIPAAHIGGVMLAFRSFVTANQGWGFGVAGLALNAAGLGVSALVISVTRNGFGPF